MKTKLPWLLSALLAAALVVMALDRQAPASAPAQVAADAHAGHGAKPERKVLYWVDPMHPAYRSDKPGKAPDCGMDLVPVYADEGGGAVAASTVKGYTSVALGPQRRQLIGVQTGKAETRSIGRTVRTVGRVAVDETRLHTVTTKFDGYIEELYADYTGKEVRRGQPLFSVYSPDLLATQQEYLLARRAASQSPALLEAARRRLQLWDVGAREIAELERTGVTRKTLTIASPTSGFVLTKRAVEGVRVVPGDPLFEIANLDRVWVLADVYESELQAVGIRTPATVTLSYLPGRTFNGNVTFISPTVDPMTRTAKVRVEVDNRDGALKPDMFADVVIQEPQRTVTVVPESAVLRTGKRAVLFVVHDDGTLEPREVETGVKTDRWLEVRRGVAAGEAVATQANFLIDSESRLKAALAQMSGPGAHGAHGG